MKVLNFNQDNVKNRIEYDFKNRNGIYKRIYYEINSIIERLTYEKKGNIWFYKKRKVLI